MYFSETMMCYSAIYSIVDSKHTLCFFSVERKMKLILVAVLFVWIGNQGKVAIIYVKFDLNNILSAREIVNDNVIRIKKRKWSFPVEFLLHLVILQPPFLSKSYHLYLNRFESSGTN